jgi:hypothetical protein
MNLYSVAMHTLRGFAARRRAAHAVKKRTYIFVLVPFDFSKNGNAKRAEITQDSIKDHSDFEHAANYKPHALRALGRGAIRAAQRQPPRWMSLMRRNSTFDSCGRGFCRIRSGRRTKLKIFSASG